MIYPLHRSVDEFQNKKCLFNFKIILLEWYQKFQQLSSQSFFEPWLEEHDQWRGLVAKAPSINDYKDALNADLFLYLGHGSGKEFLKGEAVFRKLEVSSIIWDVDPRIMNHWPPHL